MFDVDIVNAAWYEYRWRLMVHYHTLLLIPHGTSTDGGSWYIITRYCSYRMVRVQMATHGTLSHLFTFQLQ